MQEADLPPLGSVLVTHASRAAHQQVRFLRLLRSLVRMERAARLRHFGFFVSGSRKESRKAQVFLRSHEQIGADPRLMRSSPAAGPNPQPSPPAALPSFPFIGAIMGANDLNIQTENGQLGMPSNICCVVVEYLPGGALKSFLIKNRRRKLAFNVVIQLALDLARGLSYLHSKKIVHRDVKTENMLLDKTRTVKIADFGVARIEAQNPNDMTGETGTLGYMAPEVLNGNPYNRKCDVYSFGICLWEIYCCDMPYPDLSFSEITSAVVRQNLRPEIPRCSPSSLATVMKKCWDANPDKRPEMDEVVSMLESVDTSKGGGMIPVDQRQGCLSCFRRYRGP